MSETNLHPPAIDPVAAFREMYETLAGKVHVARTAAELHQRISAICAESGTKCVAVAELPGELLRIVADACAGLQVELLQPPYSAKTLPHSMDGAGVGITLADFAIADTGTLVEFTTNDASRLVSTLPRLHIGLVRDGEIMGTLDEAAPRVRAAFDANQEAFVATFISGPSRSGDIEMKLTLGVHGPAEAHAIILTGEVAKLR